MQNRIKELRAKHNLTQKALADKIGIRRETISHFEKGNYNPSLQHAYDIAEIFGLPIEEVFLTHNKSTPQLIPTEDGSHSLYLPSLDETYHSTYGAIQESSHVFIKAGLQFYAAQNPWSSAIKILEYGFGTGLNALLTAEALSEAISIHYHSLELFPLKNETVSLLNYGKLLENETLFEKLHSCSWEYTNQLNEYFTLRKTKTDFRKFTTDEKYQLIYFDAFSPSKQPELWTKAIFEQCYNLLDNGGVLVTYSAKGQLKRDLIAIGFTVESLPGPPGKFQITRAIK